MPSDARSACARAPVVRRSAAARLGYLLLAICPALAGAGPPSPPKGTLADASAAAAAVHLTDQTPPPRSDDRGFDVLSYDLEVDLDPAARTLAGEVAVGMAAVGGDTRRIVLDLVGNLECTGVWQGAGADGTARDVSGGQAVPYTHLGDSLVITLPTPLGRAAPETLTVTWQGRPLPHGPFAAGFMWRSHDAGTADDPDDDVPVVATVVEPWSAHSWWPCKDHPADKALVSLAITAPDTLGVVANGRLESVSFPAPGRRRTQWREVYPVATYLVSLAVSNFATWTEACTPGNGNGVPLEFHVFPQDRDHARIDFAPTCRMVEFMTELAGPYPFPGEKYAQVEIKWIGAMEHQTATSISQFFLTGDGRWEAVVVHELAHQWFGDSLTPSRWADIWLNEGFARYAEALWMEREHGAAAYRDFMLATGPRRHPDLFRGDGLLADPDPILPNSMIYDKGAWLLHTLRRLLGDEAFFGFLRNYAEDPALVHAGVDTDAMIAAAERAAGRSLQAFFRPWLWTETVPTVLAVIRIGRQGQVADGTTEAAVTLTQLQVPTGEVPVTVRLFTSRGVEDRLVVLDRARQTFRLATACRIDSVGVDADSLAFMVLAPATPAPLVVGGPWPNPAGPAGADFSITLQEDRKVSVDVYDARGLKLDHQELGLLAAVVDTDGEGAVGHPWRWVPPAGSPPLASGVYWLEFRAGSARAVRKLVWVR